jgi:hypothetical protein
MQGIAILLKSLGFDAEQFQSLIQTAAVALKETDERMKRVEARLISPPPDTFAPALVSAIKSLEAKIDTLTNQVVVLDNKLRSLNEAGHENSHSCGATWTGPSEYCPGCGGA